MTSRHQTVFNGASCALARSSTVSAAAEFWDASDSEGWLDYGDTTPGPNGRGDLQTPGAGYGDITLTAVPEPSVAALLGGIGLLALVRRRRG